MVLVFGPVGGAPITSVGDPRLGGVTGISQVTFVLAVVLLPVASTVGVLQVSVCVYMLAETSGATVFWIIGTERIVLQKLLLSSTITVHVPGMVVTVDVLPPRITLGVTAPVKVGGRKV